jgi:NO-binding membrane sensor protein with MHYT domain
MRHFIIISAGVAWSCIAILLQFLFGLAASDVPDVFLRFAIAGILTSYAVTRLFRSHLIQPEARENFWLPLATISSGVSIWSLLLVTLAAVQSFIAGRNDLFDGFSYFIILAVATSLTIALPVTYPAAYITQNLVSHFGKSVRAEL